jgi:2-oxoglutarate dehydrogenase E2 component (dihydrolipoamide succinyltransferase)
MIDVVMPQMGESIVEGTLTRWLKKAGDSVQRDEPLFEISTDKVDTEIPAPAAGVLAEITVEEGKTVAINTVVGKIDETGSAAAKPSPGQEPAPPPAPVAAPPPPPPPPPPAPEPVFAAPPAEEVSGPLSPLVRKMAREHQLDLSKIRGTGAGGRITKQDVEAYMAAQATPAPSAPAPIPAPPAAPAPVPPPRADQPRIRVEAMSTMRRKIAEHMVLSKHTAAHVTTVHKVDMTAVAKIRDRRRDEVKSQYGFGLTFLPFVAKAAAAALREYPIVNSSIDGASIIYHSDINIGIAVALDNGLIVPVIRNADEKSILGLQRSIVDLAQRARYKQLKVDEVQGGTFSITNFGSFGSVFATPVINQPQVAILGVGTVEKQPVVINDAIAIRSVCYLALTFDHRLIDGALADQFTGRVKQILETWSDNSL